MARKFNVFSPEIVTYVGENFEWVVNPNELPAGTKSIRVIPSNGGWPLDQLHYDVTPQAPASANVTSGNGGDTYEFECKPPASNVTTQEIIVACAAPFDVNTDVTVPPGQYFIWENSSNSPAVIRPDAANSNFWPLGRQLHVVPANDFLHVHVPDDAVEDQAYPIVVTAGFAKPHPMTQPKIIVQSDGGDKRKRRKKAKKKAAAKKNVRVGRKAAPAAKKKAAPAKKKAVPAKKKKKSKR